MFLDFIEELSKIATTFKMLLHRLLCHFRLFLCHRTSWDCRSFQTLYREISRSGHEPWLHLFQRILSILRWTPIYSLSMKFLFGNSFQLNYIRIGFSRIRSTILRIFSGDETRRWCRSVCIPGESGIMCNKPADHLTFPVLFSDRSITSDNFIEASQGIVVWFLYEIVSAYSFTFMTFILQASSETGDQESLRWGLSSNALTVSSSCHARFARSIIMICAYCFAGLPIPS